MTPLPTVRDEGREYSCRRVPDMPACGYHAGYQARSTRFGAGCLQTETYDGPRVMGLLQAATSHDRLP
jgi:hypothetical protein